MKLLLILLLTTSCVTLSKYSEREIVQPEREGRR